MCAATRVIAIDGPAAAGKGTLAQRLAVHFGYAYLPDHHKGHRPIASPAIAPTDTGLLYRAVGLKGRLATATAYHNHHHRRRSFEVAQADPLFAGAPLRPVLLTLSLVEPLPEVGLICLSRLHMLT